LDRTVFQTFNFRYRILIFSSINPLPYWTNLCRKFDTVYLYRWYLTICTVFCRKINFVCINFKIRYHIKFICVRNLILYFVTFSNPVPYWESGSVFLNPSIQ
jgi:hypothetical protein